MKKLNKRHFQLLEMMIACFLIAGCAIPMMGSYLSVYKEQKSLNQTIELDHLSHLVHARILEDLYFRGAQGEPLHEMLNKKFSLSDLDPKLLDGSAFDFIYELKIELPKSEKKRESAKKFLMNLRMDVVKKGIAERSVDSKLPHYNYKLFIAGELKKAPGLGDGKKRAAGKQDHAS
jgi:hypothetical protein